MKTIAIMPAVAAAFLALGISAASSQANCTKDFTACMDHCAGRPSKAVQDSCFQGCENKNNSCNEGVYGKRSFNAPATPVDLPKGPAKDAMAKDAEPPAPPAQAQAQPMQKPQQARPQPQAPQPNQPRR